MQAGIIKRNKSMSHYQRLLTKNLVRLQVQKNIYYIIFYNVSQAQPKISKISYLSTLHVIKGLLQQKEIRSFSNELQRMCNTAL